MNILNWIWNKRHTDGLEKQKLIDAFPTYLKEDLIGVFRVLPFEKNVRLCDGKIHLLDSLLSEKFQVLAVGNEFLTIPYRVYFNEPRKEDEQTLRDVQKTILNCIYLRHHDGFVRQKRLEMLQGKTDRFIVPYSFQLLGEYVMEILEVLDRHINSKTIDQYVALTNDNPKYWQQTESRMISYWNEYYRHASPKLKTYIGMQIIDRLKKEKTKLQP